MPEVAIFHNPACATSRYVPGLIRHGGIGPNVIDYLKLPPFTKEDGEVIEDTGARRA